MLSWGTRVWPVSWEFWTVLTSLANNIYISSLTAGQALTVITKYVIVRPENGEEKAVKYAQGCLLTMTIHDSELRNTFSGDINKMRCPCELLSTKLISFLCYNLCLPFCTSSVRRQLRHFSFSALGKLTVRLLLVTEIKLSRVLSGYKCKIFLYNLWTYFNEQVY